MSALLNVIQGTRIGDSLGLPMEGLSPLRIAQLGWSSPLKQRLIFGHGMWSDDTEHTLLLIESALKSQGNVETFQKLFSQRLCFWLSTFPPGIGLATLRSIILQSLRFPLHKTGVYSAGNAPSMRAAALGVIFAKCKNKRILYNQAQTTLTHSDPKALYASELVVEIAASFTNGITDLSPVLEKCSQRSNDPEWQYLINCINAPHNRERDTSEILKRLHINPSQGISGYSYHTVPAVVYLGLKHQWHFQDTLSELIMLGGDTDSTAAIAGALCALHPSSHISEHWDTSYYEWPLSAHVMDKITTSLESGHHLSYYQRKLWPLYVARNLNQLCILIFHILRRLLYRVIKPNIG